MKRFVYNEILLILLGFKGISLNLCLVKLNSVLWGVAARTWGTNYTATGLPLRKLSKLNEPDLQDTAGEAGTSS